MAMIKAICGTLSCSWIFRFPSETVPIRFWEIITWQQSSFHGISCFGPAAASVLFLQGINSNFKPEILITKGIMDYDNGLDVWPDTIMSILETRNTDISC